MSKKFKTLFIYTNPRSVSIVPTVVALFYRILSDAGIEMKFFDTTFYEPVEETSDDFKSRIMAVKSYEKELREKAGELYDTADLNGDLQDLITKFMPDLIMVTATESTFLYTIDILKKIKHFEIPVLLGGVFASFASRIAIKYDEIDMLCIGEAEEVIVPLCRKLEKGQDPSGMKNLWVKKKGKITKGTLLPPIDIDKNPLVDMSIFESKRFYRAMDGRVYRMLPVETHRGCPHVCGFCNAPLQNKLYKQKTNSVYFRRKSMSKVMEEIRYYVDECKAEYIFFWADNFLTYSDKEISEFCEAYSEIKLPFYVQSHPIQLSEFKIKSLAKVGLHRLGLGVEHGNEKFRREIVNRFYSNKALIENVKILHKYNISFNTNSICGFPTEKPEMVMDTVELNRKLKANNYSCSIFTPFHGTPLRNLAVRKGYLKDLDVVAPSNTTGSILDMPQFTKEQILGKARTFNMYVCFPKDRWKDIERAEKITSEGDRIWTELRQEYQEKYVRSRN